MATLLIICALTRFGGVGVKKVSTCAPTIAPLLSFARVQNFRFFMDIIRRKKKGREIELSHEKQGGGAYVVEASRV